MKSGVDGAAGDVVEQEEGLGAGDEQVVDVHGDEVDADRVVLVHGDRYEQLGADAVGAGDEHGIEDAGGQADEAGEPADVADLLGAAGAGDHRLDPADGLVAGVDVDARAGVGQRARGRRGGLGRRL
jgi:hypothetical protein